VEPGTYTSSSGAKAVKCTGSSCSPGNCNATTTTCTALQVIQAKGTDPFPITIEEDPTTSGDVTFERPASGNSYTQSIPVLAIWDSSWVSVYDLQIAGARDTGCSGACVNPGNGKGEVYVNYDSGSIPASGVQSGINLDNISVDGSNFTCLTANIAEGVGIEGDQFTNCGTQGGSSGVFLGGCNDLLSNSEIENATGNGVYVDTSSSNDPVANVTVDSNTIDGSAKFGTNTGLGSFTANIVNNNEI
jgi:hypothetical protein